MTHETHRSALHDKHVSLDARMGLDSGWDMPLSYSSSLDEARMVRKSAGIFDVSHFGRIRIKGDDSLDLLERACTCDIAHQEDDTAQWTLICNEKGGIIDYSRVLRLSDYWLILTSPTSRARVIEHLESLMAGLNVKIDDQTTKTSMVCVAGPQAPSRLQAVMPMPIASLEYGSVKAGSFLIARYIAVRGELAGLFSLDVILPNMLVSQAWRFITEKAGDNMISPSGCGAWDILRLEGGHLRYGHEINETINPYQVGLGDLIDTRTGFAGQEALASLGAKPPSRRLIGLVLTPTQETSAAPVPRQGSPVLLCDGTEIGNVTSGTFSPALEAPIAMAHVSSASAQAGMDVEVVIDENHRCGANLVNLPFVR